MFSHLTLLDISAVTHVDRWHMVEVRRPQNLAEHSFAVASIAMILASGMDYKLTAKEERDLMALALLHDIEEVDFGDLPTPTKKALKEVAPSANVVDLLEGLFWRRRGTTKPFSNSDRVIALVKVADRIETASYYKKYGTDEKIKNRLIREANEITALMIPELNNTVKLLWEEVL